MYSAPMIAALTVRKFLLRHLALPRPESWRKRVVPVKANARTGRFNSVEYLSYPWYVQPTISARYGPRSWAARLLRRKIPGDDGNIYNPEGWTFAEIGPNRQKNQGTDFMKDQELRLRSQDRDTCPFTFTTPSARLKADARSESCGPSREDCACHGRPTTC